MWKKFARKCACWKKSRVWFLLPSLTGVTVFVLIPYLDMVKRSFQTAVSGRYCGLENYWNVFTNEAFCQAVKNTMRFMAIGIPILAAVSLVLSLGVSGSQWEQGLKSFFLFPMAVPIATLVLIWKLFFLKNGIFNSCLEELGLQPVDWLGSDTSFWVLVVSYLWKNMGYTMVLWLAGMKQISVSLLEAAQVDGANRRQCFWYVVFPCLKPVCYTVIILSLLNSFKVFREAYLVAGAYPQQKMYLIQHLFNNWFANLEMDKIAAAAVCLSVVFGMMVLVLGWIWDRQD